MPALVRTMMALAGLLTLPGMALAQGTAPAQGVTQPMPQPTTPGGPPAPQPAELGDGRPRQDATTTSGTNTAPETTQSLPLPPAGQADPVPSR
jgi:hypothetical protein